jgi:hypothetical protein
MKLHTIQKILQKPDHKRGPKNSYVDTEKTYKKAGYDTEKTFGILAHFSCIKQVLDFEANNQ